MGLRGCGKSTLARRLCAVTGLPMVDLDDRTAALLGGKTAADAWNNFGEVAFRAAEVRALRQAIDDETPIIALGGGTPTAPGAEAILRAQKRERPPRIVYLRAPAGVLAARIRTGGRVMRPSLTGLDPAEEVPVILAQREPLFLDLANWVLEVGEISLDQATERVLTAAS